MSLFKARDWWRVSAGHDSVFDMSSMVMDCLAGEGEDQHMQLVLVSMAGLVQIYQPTNRPGGESRAEDLLLEQQLPQPVLQVESGMFMVNQPGRQLAVLHPRQLSVYQLSRRQGSGSQGDSYVLSLAYQHSLARSAYAAVKGTFGGVRGKDYLAVLSLDGTLSVFEQEAHTFSRFLPGFLVPGPFAYVERTDSFIVANSSFGLDSFKYQSLAVASDSKNESQEISTGRKVVPDWSFVVGEPVSNIQVIQSMDKDDPATVVVLGRQTLMAVLDTGGILWAKRLEFSPRCLLSTPSLMYDKRVISMVTTDTDTLMFYDNSTLKWATQLPYKPACMRRGKLWDREASATKDGLLVFLSEDGEVTVSYLGSDPTLYTAAPPDSRDVNYEETDRELSKLSAIIKQSQKEGGHVVSSARSPTLKIDVSVSSQLEMCQYPSRVLETEPAVPMVAVTLQLHTPSPLTRVRVNLHVTQPIMLSQNTHTITSLSDTDTVKVFAYLADTHIVSSLELSIVTTFLSADGVPNSLHKSVQLPLSLVIKPCPPIKDADFKVTLSTNKPAVSLLELFPEFVLDSSMTNAAGFQLYGGPVITVLSSKTSQRYRLQSENLPSTWIMTDHVKKRLEQKFHNELECSYSSSLPLQEFFQEIDSHFAKRQQYKHVNETLAQRMAQFRAIQRRLLMRFKDKTPTPLTNLDMLLEGTYRQVMASCEAVEDCMRDQERSAANLACIVRLLLMLAKLSAGISSEEFGRLEAALTPVIHTEQEQGWEETTDAALTFLLRTSLAKAGRENQGATPITLDPTKETTRIKKHVSSVMDRITKGGKIVDLTVAPESSPFVSEVTHTDSFDTEEEGKMEIVGRHLERKVNEDDSSDFTPMGSRFGESGERIRSARIRSARSARSRPTSAISNFGAEREDIPPDGPVDLDELERNLPPLQPAGRNPKLADIKSEKGIESPLEIFPSSAPAEEDIW